MYFSRENAHFCQHSAGGGGVERLSQKRASGDGAYAAIPVAGNGSVGAVEIGLSNQPTPGILGGRMSQETITYLTNIVIGAILAGLLTHFWWRQGRSATMRCWMLSAWVMTVADIFFALRPELPYWAAQAYPDAPGHGRRRGCSSARSGRRRFPGSGNWPSASSCSIWRC